MHASIICRSTTWSETAFGLEIGDPVMARWSANPLTIAIVRHDAMGKKHIRWTFDAGIMVQITVPYDGRAIDGACPHCGMLGGHRADVAGHRWHSVCYTEVWGV